MQAIMAESKRDIAQSTSLVERVFLHTPEPSSSAAIYVFEIVRGLSERGVRVDVICPANHDMIENFKSNPLVSVHASAARSTDGSHGILEKLYKNAAFLFSSCGVLFGAIRRDQVVHFQYAMHLPFAAIFFLVALLRGSKVVFTAHDPLPHKWLLNKNLRWMEKGALSWMYKVSDLIIVHSDSGKRTIQNNFPHASGKVEVIEHGPYELGKSLVQAPQTGTLELLLFGALRENKGGDLAIQAVQRLHKRGIPIRLTIAGRVLNRKEQDFWDRCKGLIAECPGPIRLIEEFIPESQLPELFADCHCFILPYGQFFSDSGVAFMALANGRPVLTTPAGGLKELLEASQGGLLIKSATVDDVEEAIRCAVELGPIGLEKLGKDGMEWVLRECGWPKVAAKTVEAYSAVVLSKQK